MRFVTLLLFIFAIAPHPPCFTLTVRLRSKYSEANSLLVVVSPLHDVAVESQLHAFRLRQKWETAHVDHAAVKLYTARLGVSCYGANRCAAT